MSTISVMSIMKLINRMRLTPKRRRVHKRGIIKAVGSAVSVKVFVALLAGLLSTGCLPAQSFSEWFKQKKTQKKYLLAQITALQSYSHWIEKGYQIAAVGLGAVSSFKQGDFSQHSHYFSSREKVSSAVKNYPKVSAILKMADAMSKIRKKLTSAAGSGSGLTAMLNSHELQSLKRINDAAAVEADKDLETLALLVTDGKLKMTDDERIKAINLLYTRVRKRLTATMEFDRRMQALVSSRKKQAADPGDVGVLRRLYGE